MNIGILLFGWSLVIVQVFQADADNFLRRYQMNRREGLSPEAGYSLMEHGGWWADLLLITPLAAYIVNRYDLQYASLRSILFMIISVAVAQKFGRIYSRASHFTPEAHVHWGETTPAGRTHGLYAILAMWIIGLFYFAPLATRIAPADLYLVSAILTPFFFVGAAKWNYRWFAGLKNDKMGILQSIVGPLVVWGVAIARIKLS